MAAIVNDQADDSSGGSDGPPPLASSSGGTSGAEEYSSDSCDSSLDQNTLDRIIQIGQSAERIVELFQRYKEEHGIADDAPFDSYRAVFQAWMEENKDALLGDSSSASQPSASPPSAQPSASQPSASQPSASEQSHQRRNKRGKKGKASKTR